LAAAASAVAAAASAEQAVGSNTISAGHGIDIVVSGTGPFDNSIAVDETELVLDKTDVGLDNVDNTSDASKPVSTAQGVAIDAKVFNLAYNTTNWSGKTTTAPSADDIFDKIQSMISDVAYGSSWEPYTVTAASKGSIYDAIEALRAIVEANEVNRYLLTTATGDSTISVDASEEDCHNVMYLDRATQITINNMPIGKTIVIAYYGAISRTVTWAGEPLKWAGGLEPPAIALWTLVTITKVWPDYSLASFSNGYV